MRHYENGRLDVSRLESSVERKKAVAGFVPFSTRGTNNYGHIHNAVFACTRNPNPDLFRYIRDSGGVICESTYAVSDLIQWVFRTAIRNGENINLSIFCVKMRSLFKLWLCTNVFESLEVVNISDDDIKRFDKMSIYDNGWKHVESEFLKRSAA